MEPFHKEELDRLDSIRSARYDDEVAGHQNQQLKIGGEKENATLLYFFSFYGNVYQHCYWLLMLLLARYGTGVEQVKADDDDDLIISIKL